jgi:hypothetical protein
MATEDSGVLVGTFREADGTVTKNAVFARSLISSWGPIQYRICGTTMTGEEHPTPDYIGDQVSVSHKSVAPVVFSSRSSTLRRSNPGPEDRLLLIGQRKEDHSYRQAEELRLSLLYSLRSLSP